MAVNKVSYVTEAKYLEGVIKEFDIRKANINILYNKGVLDLTTYWKLLKAPRMERQVYIGNMIDNDKSMYKILAAGLIEFKDKFYQANQIEDSDIVSIHNDSIFLINKNPLVTRFDNIEFIDKGTYNSFYRILDLEVYYSYNRVYNTESISIKGINDNTLIKHKEYMIEFLCTLFSVVQIEGVTAGIEILTNFYNQYINRKLESGYYREFNPDSLFKLNNRMYSDIMPDERYVSIIDISYNVNFLRDLFGILTSLYFK
jgi:hypothetical protein